MTRDEWGRAAKAAKALRGETYDDIAEAVYYSKPYVINIINGFAHSKRAEAVLSDYLRIEPPTE